MWGVYNCPTDCMVCIHTVTNKIWSGSTDHLDVLDLITLGLNCYALLCALLGPLPLERTLERSQTDFVRVEVRQDTGARPCSII